MNNLVERSKQTALGKIPTEWNFKKLEDCTEKVGSGVTPKGGSKAYVESGIPLLRSQNILSGKLKLADVAFITQVQHDKMKGSKLKPGDVLLNITGASIGRCAVLPDNFDEGNVNQHVCIIRTNDLLVPSYCGFFLNSAMGQKQIWSLQAGGNREGLNFQQIKSFSMIVPPREEQQKIAEVLSTVDQKIDLIDQKITETKKLKTGLMQKLFSEGVGVQDEEGGWQPHTEFGSLPTGKHPAVWLPTILNEVCEKIGDGIHSTPKYVEESKFKFINGNNIKDGSLVITSKTKCVSQSEYEKHRKELSLETVLLSINGTIGSLAYYDGSEVVLGKSAAYLSVKGKISKEFLYYYLSTSNVSKWFDKGLTGTTIKNLSLKAIRNTPIALPSAHEQEAITNVLMEVDKKIKLLKKQKVETQQLKKGLMQKLLTGEWRVPLDNH
ncbi:hypothetical protein BCT41_08665 [Vibrio splendidus]|uniref:restriction endonuclease subunit S n=3 Tax=Vibrio TaxID=662 RepID=UPI000CC27197|nr:restriction endonuclease subunit S [Vibrio splendidus]PMN03358.1 hypothetical protein BCT41_08665 [Vibrio splendidus]